MWGIYGDPINAVTKTCIEIIVSNDNNAVAAVVMTKNWSKN